MSRSRRPVALGPEKPLALSAFADAGAVLRPTARNVLSSRVGVHENAVGQLVEGDG